MEGPHVEVLEVPHGGVVWLHNLGLGEEHELRDGVLNKLREKIGHNDFCVVCTDDDGCHVEVVGEDEIVSRVKAALTEAHVV